jgi:pimeloyl-ACP methyl ester carboxylesterase
MRIVLVHGSVTNGPATWAPLEPLKDRFELVVPSRGGYPPNPPLERIDFEEQADQLAPLLGDAAHLVGHSYGGVISLLMAARHPDRVRSLTVNEPPAFGLARGRPEVEKVVADFDAYFSEAPSEPGALVRGFLAIVGSEARLPDPLPPDLEQGALALRAERRPWEADLPLEELAAAPFPKLVVSGRHSAAFDTVCDVLEEQLGAERAVLPGAGHSLPRAPGYTQRLEAFLSRSSS